MVPQKGLALVLSCAMALAQPAHAPEQPVHAQSSLLYSAGSADTSRLIHHAEVLHHTHKHLAASESGAPPKKRLSEQHVLEGAAPWKKWLFGGSDSSSVSDNKNPPKEQPRPAHADLDFLQQYDDEVVLRFTWSQPSDKAHFAKAVQGLLLDVWRMSATEADVRIQSSRVKDLYRLLPKSMRQDVQYSTLIPDLARTVFSSYPDKSSNDVFSAKVEQSLKSVQGSSSANNIKTANNDLVSINEVFFQDYRPLETIYHWLELLEVAYPEIIQLKDIGHTHEGRPIRTVHLHGPNARPDRSKLLVTGAIHAREWISTSSVLYTIYELATGYGSNRQLTEFVDKFEFIFVPVVNPDGYVFSWDSDRLWRKNRQPTGVSFCTGLDIDHSFGYQWHKTRGTPCSESYSGQEPLEALEAKYLTEFVSNHTTEVGTFHGFLDLHSYSEEILYPYSYSCDRVPRDFENLVELAYGLAKAIRITSGKRYVVMPACEDRDLVGDTENGGGSMLDFLYSNHCAWAFQVKLRDTGNYGFLLPKKQILPTGQEMFNSLRYFCDFILNPE